MYPALEIIRKINEKKVEGTGSCLGDSTCKSKIGSEEEDAKCQTNHHRRGISLDAPSSTPSTTKHPPGHLKRCCCRSMDEKNKFICIHCNKFYVQNIANGSLTNAYSKNLSIYNSHMYSVVQYYLEFIIHYNVNWKKD